MTPAPIDAYRVGKFFYRLGVDREFLERVRADFEPAVEGLGLTVAEKDAIQRGDLRSLYGAGVSGFLLSSYSRHGLFGVDRATYQRRMAKVPRGPRPWAGR